MFDQDGGGFDVTMSESKDTKEPVRRAQNLMPLVCRQLISQVDDELKIFGQQIQMVSFVGILRNFNVQSTKITCEIEDHTGTVKCILWLDKDKENVEVPEVTENSYVRAIGTLRQQNDSKIVMLLKLLPVDDCNVILNHIIEAMNARYEAEDEQRKDTEADTVPDFAQDANASTSATHIGGFTDMQNKVYQLLSRNKKDDGGMSRIQVLAAFNPNQKQEVNAALEFLMQEGHAYTTYDSEHFQAT